MIVTNLYNFQNRVVLDLVYQTMKPKRTPREFLASVEGREIKTQFEMEQLACKVSSAMPTADLKQLVHCIN